MTTIEPSDGPSETLREIALKDIVRIFGTVQKDVDGWLFGAAGGDLTPAGPALEGDPDGYEGSLVIGTTVAALDAFGDGLTRKDVLVLLPLWRHSHNLTPADRVAVLKRFPRSR